MAPLPIAKLIGVFAKQIAKPLSSRIVAHAKAHPLFQAKCVWVGQTLHVFSVRILQRSESQHLEHVVAIDKTPYLKYVEKPEADGQPADGDEDSVVLPPFKQGHLKKGKVVTLCEESQVADRPRPADEDMKHLGAAARLLVSWRSSRGKTIGRQYAWIPKEQGLQATLKTQRVKPLPEEEALDTGAVFMGEAIVFSVAGGIVIWEYLRQQAKEKRLLHEKHMKKQRKDQLQRELDEKQNSELEALRHSMREQAVALRALQDRSTASLQQERRLLGMYSLVGGALAGLAAGTAMTWLSHR